MDANETTSTEGRVQIDESNTQTFSGTTTLHTNLDHYRDYTEDAYKLKHPGPLPILDHRTHQGVVAGLTTHSIIDYSLISSNLSERLDKCILVGNPGTHEKNFHLAILTCLK